MCCTRAHRVRRRHGNVSSVTSTLSLGPHVAFIAKVSLDGGAVVWVCSGLHDVGGVGFVPDRVDSVPLDYWWRLRSGDTQRFIGWYCKFDVAV